MSDYRVGIAAHQARSVQAHDLYDKVSAVHMAMDDGTFGCGGNHGRCWSYLAARNPERWSVVLEDDCEPVDGFNTQLEQALAAAPSPVVSLYLGHPQHWSTHTTLKHRLLDAGRRADEQDACWITTEELLHGVGVAIKTSLVPSMLEYLKTSDRPYDYAIRNWARTNGHTISLAWPSIVDHADGETLVKHPDSCKREERKAWRAGTRTEWTRRSVGL